MNTRVLTAHIPDKLAKKIDFFSERLDRPKGWIVKHALEQFVTLEERRYQMTLEGLADLQQGNVVEHSEIKAWAAKLGKTAKR